MTYSPKARNVESGYATGQQIFEHAFFLSEADLQEFRERDEVDYIVIGTGFCALAFVERVLMNNPFARILLIEAGPFFTPEHVHNLPLPYQQNLIRLSESFPWTVSAKTAKGPYVKWQHGVTTFFGGRSLVWSAWCPRPTKEEMKFWPKQVIDAANEYFGAAEKLLGVTTAGRIETNGCGTTGQSQPLFGRMQRQLMLRIRKHLAEVGSANKVMAAPLAITARNAEGTDFDKFSTPAPILTLLLKQQQLEEKHCGSRLRIVTDCKVTRMRHSSGRVTALETNRGLINVRKAKVILAMGTLPATTLMLNSFPELKNIGQRFSAHFVSAILARVPKEDFEFYEESSGLELAAIYVPGIDQKSGRQYHLQIRGFCSNDPAKSLTAAIRHTPAFAATSPKPLLTSDAHIVFACTALGELDHANSENWFRLDEHVADISANGIVQAVPNENDDSVWNTMEESAFRVLERTLSPKGAPRVEYWHGASSGDLEAWNSQRPAKQEIRRPGLVHEASTMWIGSDDDEDAVVGLDYRPRGVENVFVTGAALWPTAGSWNPTLTMVALSQHLADILSTKTKSVGEQPHISTQDHRPVGSIEAPVQPKYSRIA